MKASTKNAALRKKASSFATGPDDWLGLGV
jgi:hypothetical protein